MPTYDYVCTNCGHRLEVLHGVNAPGPTACPDCGGRLRRSFSPPTIHFKGSGWAKVDRRSASSSRSSKADSDAAPAAASSDDGSEDARDCLERRRKRINGFVVRGPAFENLGAIEALGTRTQGCRTEDEGLARGRVGD